MVTREPVSLKHLFKVAQAPRFEQQQQQQQQAPGTGTVPYSPVYQPPRPERPPPRHNDHADKCTTHKVTLSKWEVQASARAQLEARQYVDLQPKADELVLVIDIEWSDNRRNQVKRTLNEVSILERDMRHELLGMKRKDCVDKLDSHFKLFRGKFDTF